MALIAGRVIQGAGGALMIPQVLTGIQLAFDERPARTRALGLYSIALAGGAVAGQVLGGVIVAADLLGAQWRPIFLINVPIAAAVMAAGVRLLPADRAAGPRERLDLPGVATLSAGLLLLVLPLTLGREAGWPAWTWISLAASAPALAAFVAVERRAGASGRTPLLNLHVLARPAIRWGLWPQAIAISTYYGLLFTLALYLQQGLGLSPLVSGLTLVSWVAAFGVPGRLIAHVPDRWAPRLAPAGCLILAAGYLAISASMAAGHHEEALLVVLLGVGGFGLGTAFSAILGQLTAAATPRYAPDISGVFTTSLQVAGAIGIAVFGTAYLALATGGEDAATRAFAVMTAVFAATALLAAAIAQRASRFIGDR